MKLKCLIIDDEPDAVKALELLLCEYVGDRVEIAGSAYSVKEGRDLISRLNPDLVFLDIEMPHGGGFSVLQDLPGKKFRFVFVSAYDNYAMRALKMKAEDYLLKPVDPDELVQLVNTQWETHFAGLYKIKIPLKHTTLLADPANVVYIKGEGRYSEIILDSGSTYLVSKNIGLFEQELKNHQFFRIHKSFLVNLRHVIGLNTDDSVLMSNKHRPEISRRKKQDLKSKL
ncbi:MAG: response regulator transcription factor [Bacteroidia bacterium]|nr:response regulator transcription factor [Bacteroidia bacterium]